MSGQQFVEPICVRVNDAARMIGIGRTKLYELIASGEIETLKIGRATRVTTASLHAFARRYSQSEIGEARMG
ncbi:helix-turn-helix domain-containing protein [Aurantiacibacter spongiae]|uniref:DNA-binding protein n=1 Tax=Aurantiacibacter spongiae TaxID=2488860 RepID=A0A3N5DL94_9SPHN|nr:helix-turn-helix domain-containing protein [Aurantiacibacter spongiae]RPF72462.1 DNA-binding protein [Aurantiacibacter spongiae]